MDSRRKPPADRPAARLPASQRRAKPAATPGAPRAGRKPDHPFVTAFADYARAECHLADNSVEAYRRDLRRFYEWLAGRNPAKLTVRELADYASWLHDLKLA